MDVQLEGTTTDTGTTQQVQCYQKRFKQPATAAVLKSFMGDEIAGEGE